MQFSDTTNESGLIQDCEFWTNLGKAGISGDSFLLATFVRNINSWYQNVVSMILQGQDGWDYDDINHTDFPILNTNTIASQRDYSLTADEEILQVKRVEVTYDGTNWYKAEPFDSGERGLTIDDGTVDADFNKTQPKYDIQYNSIFLYPKPDIAVTGGLKIYVTRGIDEFTSSDTIQEPGIDKFFHRMLSVGASYDWVLVNKSENTILITRLEKMLDDYEQGLKKHYGLKVKDRILISKPAFVNYE